jgi:GT2 family glycosyltransferase
MRPELSVVILSYNQFAGTTGPCLESLARVTAPELEIIVVDNCSDGKTRTLLQQAAGRDSRLRLLLNEENRGYAGGNNDGVALARADLIVLLNSDTLVLPRSLALLADGLRSSSAPLILGPVTNAAGNEQQIFVRPGSVEEILQQGKVWSGHARGSSFATDQLSFFCVAMAKKTYAELGGLDEGFGLGFYEDTDFCCRAARQGLALSVLEESFVYHRGSASFATMPARTRELLKLNRRRFREKNGRVAMAHVRAKNLGVLRRYLAEPAEERSDASWRYRFNNRLDRAAELQPNNPLKRLLYLWRLDKVRQAARRAGRWLPPASGDRRNLQG